MTPSWRTTVVKLREVMIGAKESDDYSKRLRENMCEAFYTYDPSVHEGI